MSLIFNKGKFVGTKSECWLDSIGYLLNSFFNCNLVFLFLLFQVNSVGRGVAYSIQIHELTGRQF